MYKIQFNSVDTQFSNFENEQLVCSYIYLKKTFNHLYKKNLRMLNKKEQKAIIYDLSQFETIKQKKYLLRCLTPQKWLESWTVFNGITDEIKKRDLSIKNLDFA